MNTNSRFDARVLRAIAVPASLLLTAYIALPLSTQLAYADEAPDAAYAVVDVDDELIAADEDRDAAADDEAEPAVLNVDFAADGFAASDIGDADPAADEELESANDPADADDDELFCRIAHSNDEGFGIDEPIAHDVVDERCEVPMEVGFTDADDGEDGYDYCGERVRAEAEGEAEGEAEDCADDMDWYFVTDDSSDDDYDDDYITFIWFDENGELQSTRWYSLEELPSCCMCGMCLVDEDGNIYEMADNAAEGDFEEEDFDAEEDAIEDATVDGEEADETAPVEVAWADLDESAPEVGAEALEADDCAEGTAEEPVAEAPSADEDVALAAGDELAASVPAEARLAERVNAREAIVPRRVYAA